jgi:catechol 2,3-dioxygenase-like lactoylglutathione lyase family enzyme
VHGPGVDLSDNVARLPVRPGNSDLCFVWPGPIAEAVAHLERQGVEIETGPVPRLGAQGSGTSVYFRDPDGSLLEFISYTRPGPG